MSKEKIEVGDWVRLTGKKWAVDYPDSPEYVQVREVNGFIYADPGDVVGAVGEFPGNGLFSGSPGEYDCEWVPASEVPAEIRFKGHPSTHSITEIARDLADKLNSAGAESTHDPVDPKHYRLPGGVELIDIVRHMGYLEGNILKYVTRYKQKNGVEDLLKARKYLNWLIEDEEKA